MVVFLHPTFKPELIKYALQTARPTPHLPSVTGAILLVTLQIHISRYKWWSSNHPSKQINLHSSPRHTTTCLPGCIFKYQNSLSFKTPPKTCRSHVLSSAKLERPTGHDAFVTFEYSPLDLCLHVTFEPRPELHTQTFSPPRVPALLHPGPTSHLPPFLAEDNKPASTHQDPHSIGCQPYSTRAPTACQEAELNWNLTRDKATHVSQTKPQDLQQKFYKHILPRDTTSSASWGNTYVAQFPIL